MVHQLVIAESREFLPFFLYIRAVGLAGIVNWLSATDSNTSSTTASNSGALLIFQGFRLKPLAKLQSSCFFKTKQRFY